MGVILFIVAFVLTGLVTLISLVIQPLYYIFTFKFVGGVKQLNAWFYKMALAIDQFGNVSCSSTLRLLLTKREGHEFGNEDDTVSYVIGRNKFKNTLTIIGKGIERILNFLDKKHAEKAIEKKIESDRLASWRYKRNKYYE